VVLVGKPLDRAVGVGDESGPIGLGDLVLLPRRFSHEPEPLVHSGRRIHGNPETLPPSDGRSGFGY
jgi:hypothetical protein